MQNYSKTADASGQQKSGAGLGGDARSNPATITIGGMSGEACVQKVKAALQGVAGVVTNSVRVGEAKITATEAGCDAACDSISAAGYRPERTTAAAKSAAENEGMIAGRPTTNGAGAGKPAVDTDADRGHMTNRPESTPKIATPGASDVSVKPNPATAGIKNS